MNSYISFDQFWTTIPQEIWSDHQKGKMVKIRVWVCTSIFGSPMLHVTLIHHLGPLRLLMLSFKPWITFLRSQLDSWPRNQLDWGKRQQWPIDSQTSWILTHINIMNSYEPFDQVWTTIPQEIWSDHQKGKMVIFRVLTAQDRKSVV